MHGSRAPNQAVDAPAYPRYFVHVRNGTLIRVDGPDGAARSSMWDGATHSLEAVLRYADEGQLREITARDADALLAKANVQQANESTGARRSKA